MRRQATLMFAAAFALALPAAAQADMLIENVEGLAFDADDQLIRFVALWIDDDGRVRQLIERRDAKPAAPTLRIDGQGRTLLPGMIDSHVDVMAAGFMALTLDLSDATSLDDALGKAAAYAAKHPARPWVLGRGWDAAGWGTERALTASDLDAVVADRPVWLVSADGDLGWANSAAMAAAGVDASTKAPPGGRIMRRTAGGAPSGMFTGTALALIEAAAPRPTPADRDLALQKAQDAMLAAGVTAAADMGTSIEAWQAYRRAGDRDLLRMRIIGYADGTEAMELIAGPGPTPWLYRDRLRLNGVHFDFDGSLASRGAWLKQPYADDAQTSGVPKQSSTRLRNLMSCAALDSFQIAIDAGGDAAVSEALTAIDELAQTYTGDRRWRIEEAHRVDPRDLARFGAHGALVSMQPVRQTRDRALAERRLGAGRLDGAYAWRSIAASGAPLVFGSGAPAAPPAPFDALATAISRSDPDGEPFGGWQPAERINREQALRAFTASAAFGMFADDRFGRLAVGEYADFILVNRDPMLASPRDMRATVVLETWVGGRRVYMRAAP